MGMALGWPLLLLPVIIAAAVLVFVGGRGVSVFQKQGVAWGLTALMIVAAIGIGFAKGSGNEYEYIHDDANVLSASTEKALAERNDRLLNRYGVVIGVVACNYGRDDLYDYALKQFEKMGLSGRSFIAVLDIKGDSYWLVQGPDLVWDFTDEDCGYYAWNYMEQDFARGNYNAAVLSLTEMLEAWYGTYFG